jgi:membrane protease YdiL (CAAX protease family)
MDTLARITPMESKQNIQKLSKGITIRNLTIFIIVVLASGWIGHAVDVQTGSTGVETPGLAVWLLIPLPFSLLLRAFAGDGWKDFGLKPNFRGNLRWYAFALLVYPVMTALTLLAGKGLGLITFPGFSFEALGVILPVFAGGLLFNTIKNIFEEGAWRGYLAPKVYSLGLNDFVGHIIVGLIWGAWHLPYYLFFLSGDYLHKFTTLDLALYIPLVMVVYIAWAIVFGEVWMRTRSIWPALLMHAVEDAMLLQLFEGNLIQIVPGTDWLISPMNGLLMVLFFLALGIGLVQTRKRVTSVSRNPVLS